MNSSGLRVGKEGGEGGRVNETHAEAQPPTPPPPQPFVCACFEVLNWVQCLEVAVWGLGLYHTWDLPQMASTWSRGRGRGVPWEKAMHFVPIAAAAAAAAATAAAAAFVAGGGM